VEGIGKQTALDLPLQETEKSTQRGNSNIYTFSVFSVWLNKGDEMKLTFIPEQKISHKGKICWKTSKKME
jgi:hypothetical protein